MSFLEKEDHQGGRRENKASSLLLSIERTDQQTKMQGGNEEDLQKLMADFYMDSFATVYNGITEKCFNACVFNFRTPKLADKEELCVDRCIEKHQQYSLRVQRVFTEHNILQQQQQQQQPDGATNQS